MTWTYGEAGSPYLVTRECLADGTSYRQFGYDTFNADTVTRFRLTSFIDERFQPTSYDYTALGQLETVTDALDQTTTHTYYTPSDGAKQGLLHTVTDRRDILTAYAYDNRRRQTAAGFAFGRPEEHFTTTTYDPDIGHVQTVTTGLAKDSNYAHPATTTYTHDKLNRLTVLEEQISDTETRTTTTTYHPTSTVSTVTDPLGRFSFYQYDTADRRSLVGEAANTPANRWSATGYDAAGNVASLYDPLGRVTLYGYDAVNRQTLLIEAWGRPAERTRGAPERAPWKKVLTDPSWKATR